MVGLCRSTLSEHTLSSGKLIVNLVVSFLQLCIIGQCIRSIFFLFYLNTVFTDNLMSSNSTILIAEALQLLEEIHLLELRTGIVDNQILEFSSIIIIGINELLVIIHRRSQSFQIVNNCIYLSRTSICILLCLALINSSLQSIECRTVVLHIIIRVKRTLSLGQGLLQISHFLQTRNAGDISKLDISQQVLHTTVSSGLRGSRRPLQGVVTRSFRNEFNTCCG